MDGDKVMNRAIFENLKVFLIFIVIVNLTQSYIVTNRVRLQAGRYCGLVCYSSEDSGKIDDHLALKVYGNQYLDFQKNPPGETSIVSVASTPIVVATVGVAVSILMFEFARTTLFYAVPALFLFGFLNGFVKDFFEYEERDEERDNNNRKNESIITIELVDNMFGSNSTQKEAELELKELSKLENFENFNELLTLNF